MSFKPIVLEGQVRFGSGRLIFYTGGHKCDLRLPGKELQQLQAAKPTEICLTISPVGAVAPAPEPAPKPAPAPKEPLKKVKVTKPAPLPGVEAKAKDKKGSGGKKRGSLFSKD
jgi:hypothetical protein